MEKKSFDIMKNGYNRYQVDDYISDIKLQVEVLTREVQIQTLEKEELKNKFNEVSEQYQKVLADLSVKEKAASEMARMAMKEANMIVDTAQQNADSIVKEALMTARGILLDIARLGNEANALKGNMKDELQQLELALDEFETPEIPDMELLKKEL